MKLFFLPFALWISVFTPLASATQPTPAPQPKFQNLAVVNAKADFERFWSAAKNSSIDQQKTAFKKEFITGGYGALLRSVYYGDGVNDADFNKQLDQDLEAFLPKMASAEAAIKSQGNDFNNAVNIQEKAFFVFFPDASNLFQKHRVVVYLVPTLGKFAGKVQQVSLPIKNSKKTFKLWVGVFGMDTLSVNQLNPGIVFSRYLFELYSRLQAIEKGTTLEATAPLEQFWSEGLATYVGGQFNSGQKDAAVLMDAALADSCKQNLKQYADTIWSDYNETKKIKKGGAQKEDELRAKWFSTSATSNALIATPSTRCVGFQVARRIGKLHKLQELATMDFKTVRPYVERQLELLSGAVDKKAKGK